MISGSEVDLTNVGATGPARPCPTSSGLFRVLEPEAWQIRAVGSKSGFARVRIVDVLLDARQEKRVDVTLGVAGVQQTVEVTADVNVIDAENAIISSTMSNQQVTQLPSNYRGGLQALLLQLVPRLEFSRMIAGRSRWAAVSVHDRLHRGRRVRGERASGWANREHVSLVGDAR